MGYTDTYTDLYSVDGAAFGDVTLLVEIAFEDDPLATSPTWTDVSGYVRTVDTNYGRSHELDTISAGTATLTFDNRDGRFDPTYTSGTYYPNILPMKQIRIRATYNSVTYPVWRGFIQSWPQTWPSMVDAAVTAQCVDGFFLFNQVFTETTEAQETSGVRIGNLLDDAGWPSAWRDLAAGDVTVQSYTPSCSTILSLIQKVEETEVGLFFIAPDGDATFQAQSYRTSPTSSATFGDGTGELHYTNLELGYDDTQIWNRIEISRYGGGTVAAEDTTSQGSYGKRTLRRYDLLHTDDAESTTMAGVLKSRYREPHIRVETMAFVPASDPSNLWPQALGLSLSDYVTVKRRPSGGNTVTVSAYVEGVSHQIDAQSGLWETTLNLSQYS